MVWCWRKKGNLEEAVDGTLALAVRVEDNVGDLVCEFCDEKKARGGPKQGETASFSQSAVSAGNEATHRPPSPSSLPPRTLGRSPPSRWA